MSALIGRSHHPPIVVSIVLPYLLLTILLGSVGTFVVSRLLNDAYQARLTGELLDTGRTTTDTLGQVEARQVDDLRTIANTNGVVAAVSSGQDARLRALVEAIKVNQGDDWVEIVDRRGQRRLGLVTPPGSPSSASRSLPVSQPNSWPIVRAVLAGQVDNLGDKQVAILDPPSGPFLFVAGPLKESGPSGDQIVGAVVVGTRVGPTIAGLQHPNAAEVDLFWPDGGLLAGQLESASRPTGDVIARAAQSGAAEQLPLARPSGSWSAMLEPVRLRDKVDAVLLVAVPSSSGFAPDSLSKGQLIALVTIGMALVVLTGVVLARSLVGPIERLVDVTRAVAAGDLAQRSGVRRSDEIGQLAAAFDQMTASLADYTGRLEEMYLNTVHSLAMALDARDPYTHGHSARVADYAVRTARQLRLDEAEIAQLRIGAYLHDVGKIGVADAILQKPGPLTDEEWEIMRRHPEVGAQILQPVGFTPSVMDVVLHHHERYDGEGFPWGIAGDEIPLLARIVCVCDAYDAMTSKRAYRNAKTPEDAYDELTRGAGTQFDPRVVEAFGAAQQLGGDLPLEVAAEPVGASPRSSMLAVIERSSP